MHDQAWWMALLAALSGPSIPRLIWKGWKFMQAIFPIILKIFAVLTSLILIAEDAIGPGSGAEKKAKVIADVQDKLPKLSADLGLPPWVVSVFGNEAFLSIIIDALVGSAKAAGHLSGTITVEAKDAPTAPAAPAATPDGAPAEPDQL